MTSGEAKNPRLPSDGVLMAASFAVIAGVYTWFFVNAFRRIGSYKSDGMPTGDFTHFYYAARAMAEGQDVYASGRGGYIYPPLLAFLYSPFGRLSPDGAALALLFVNVALGLCTTWVAARAVVERVGAPLKTVSVVMVGAAATVLAVDKLKGEYQMWQTNVIVMLMFAVALWQLDRRAWLAGLALGLAFNIKYLPVAALPYLLVRRRWAAAGWFVVGIVAFALLPAVLAGWETNLGYLKTAFAGFARLLGVSGAAGPKANIDPIDIAYSVSVTSSLARLFRGAPAPALAVGGAVAAAYAGLLLLMYRARGVPSILWPREREQGAPMFRVMVMVEWVGLIVLVLCFGPQTNMRHMSLLLVVFAPGAAILLLAPAGVSRWVLAAGTLVLVLGINLPPGGWAAEETVARWRLVGGPSLCALVYFATLVWAGLALARALQAAPERRSAASSA